MTFRGALGTIPDDMRVGFDLRPSLKEETGVGVYYRTVLAHMARLPRGGDIEAFLFSSSWKDRFPPDRLPPFARRRVADLRCPVRLVNRLWGAWGWPPLDAVFRARLDLTHSPTALVLPTRGRSVVTVYDLFFMSEPARSDREAVRVFRRRIRGSVARADGVVVISEFTRAEVLRRLDLRPEKVRVARPGVGAAFREPLPAPALEEARSRLGVPPRFALFVGALERRKNVPGLLHALKRLRDGGLRVPLVVAGRDGEDAAEVRRTATLLGLEGDVRLTGYLAERDVRALYGLADLLVVPSFEEGFGMTLAEAMASGLPAAVSASGALPEVGGNAAAYFDPRDSADMADAIAGVWSDPGRRAAMAARGREVSAAFEWDRAAAETLSFYEQVLGAA